MDLDKIVKVRRNKVISLRITDDEFKFIKEKNINPAKLFIRALEDLRRKE